MTTPRTAHRFRLGLLLSLCLALALGSYWILVVLQKKGQSDGPVVARTAPDYYVQKFTAVKLDKSQQGRYHLSGDLMNHLPKDDSFEVIRPVINELGSGKPPSMLRSDRALINSDGSEIRMIDHVVMDRPAAGKSEHFHLTSQMLVLLPDDDIIKTNQPVQLQLGSSTLTGNSMLANNATGQLNLSGRVHGHYLPGPVR